MKNDCVIGQERSFPSRPFLDFSWDVMFWIIMVTVLYQLHNVRNAITPTLLLVVDPLLLV